MHRKENIAFSGGFINTYFFDIVVSGKLYFNEIGGMGMNDKKGNNNENKKKAPEKDMISKWGGKIVVKSVFENGKLRNYAVCQKTGRTSERPVDLM